LGRRRLLSCESSPQMPESTRLYSASFFAIL
jgi:hypothetical protein